MHRVDWTIRALADLDRLENFLFTKNGLAAKRAVLAILEATERLAMFPDSGRMAAEDGYRELHVRFASGGYLVLYRVVGGVVRIVRVRRDREAGY